MPDGYTYMCDKTAYNINKISSQNAPCKTVNTKVSCLTFTANLCKYFEQLWGDVHISTESTHFRASALKQNGSSVLKQNGSSALKQNGSRFLKYWFRTQKVRSCH